ncbi:insulinase family protein [Butyrivibrio sp. MC2013]|uniref:insulinase family protein n=1 Tax=Butyrivibrio sp. MC2013 TaxID=1280686 RepID=UPI000478FBD8|nr:insulinase family protein [Butyrivibrio sp. MC2013]
MKVTDLTAYEIIEHRAIDDIGSDSYILKHKKTGARIAVLSNDDENKVFYIGFRTPPKDSTGVAHIIEHTVLCGSRDFPVKDPFIVLAKGSLNTFLNAMTYPDKTVYPVASCNDTDFRNLMHVYLDAVFYPNIYNTDNIFKQEGWHYELKDPSDDLKINGIVYNEMKGAFSNPDDILDREILNSLYPDNSYGFESGGDPEKIPDLTYEDYLDFHRKYYHPSNSYIYLYGNMDVAENLDYLDREYLSSFDRQDYDSSLSPQKPFANTAMIDMDYSVLDDEEEEGGYLSLNWSVGNSLDPKLYLALDVLDYSLCSAPGAIVKKALYDKGLGTDVYSSFENGLLQPFFSIVSKNVDISRKAEFLDTIRETLEEAVKNGLDKKALEGAINTDEFRFREADFGRLPKGLVYGLKMLDSWLYDDRLPWIHLEAGDTYKELRKELSGDYFEKLIQTYLLDNPHRSVVTLNPVKGLGEKKQAELDKKLADYKASLTAKEIEDIVKATAELKAFQEREDSPEALATIPMLSIEDLKKEPDPFIYEEKHFGDNVLLYHDIQTNGIAYLTFQFDMKDIPDDLYDYASILRSVLGQVDTEHYDYNDFYNEVNIRTGGMRVDTAYYSDKKDINLFKNTFEIEVKVLKENLRDAFELATELVMTSKMTDKTRLGEILDEKKSHMQSGFISGGNVTAYLRAISGVSPVMVSVERLVGVSAYEKVKAMDENYDEATHKELSSKLEELMRCLFRRENLLISYTSPSKDYGDIEALCEEFADKLYKDECRQGSPVFKPVARNEAFKTAGQVQYVAIAGNFAKEGLSYNGALKVLKMILGYDYLYNNIRITGGAYGVQGACIHNGDSYMVTYRDPHLGRSLDVFRKVADFVRDFDCDDRTMTQYIIGTIGEIDTPATPSMKASRGMAAYITRSSIEDEREYRRQVLEATVSDIRALAAYIEAYQKNACICVVGTAEKIDEYKDLFDVIRQL